MIRILQNKMRWFKNVADNVSQVIRELEITPEHWDMIFNNFNGRIPMFNNHDYEQVIGYVDEIGVKDDGLYALPVINDGSELSGFMPSGDFVVKYDDKENIIDMSLTGLSIVPMNGAENVEHIAMSGRVIEEKSSIEEKPMEREEILEILSSEEFINSLPDEVIEKIITLRKTADDSDKEPEKQTVRDREDEAVGTAESDMERGDKPEGDKDEKEVLIRQSAFADDIILREHKDGCKFLPSQIQKANEFIKKTVNVMDFDEVKEYLKTSIKPVIPGREKTEVVQMSGRDVPSDKRTAGQSIEAILQGEA